MHVPSKTFFPSGFALVATGALAVVAAAVIAGAGAEAEGAVLCATPFGALPVPLAGAAAALTAGELQFAPALLAIYATARCTSSSVRSGFPPFGGMARMPWIA